MPLCRRLIAQRDWYHQKNLKISRLIIITHANVLIT
jgi:hypothetical protein